MGYLDDDALGSVTRDRGTLVSEPSPERVIKERMGKLKVAAVALVSGSAAAAAFYLQMPSESNGFIALNLYFVLLSSITATIIALAYVVWFLRYEPQRVYTRGVSIPRFPGGDRFMPWGRFKKVTWHGATVDFPVPQWADRFVEQSVSKVAEDEHEDDRIELWEPDDTSSGSLTITRDAPAFHRIVELASERVNDPQYDSPEYVEDLRVKFRNGVVTGALVSMLIVALFGSMVVEFPSMFGYGLELYFVYLFSGTIVFFLMGMSMDEPKKWAEFTRKAPGDRTPVLTTVAVTLVLLAATTVSFHLASGGDLAYYDTDTDMEPDPKWSILVPGTYVNETIHATGPLRVAEGETLSLVGCNVSFDTPAEGRIGFWVAEGGHLEMVRTNVTTGHRENGYYFEVYGSAVIQGCIIERVWSSVEGHEHNRDSGLEVYSDDVRIDNTTIRDCVGNAIMVVEASPIIVDCTFEDILDDGIESVVASPWMQGCTFRNCTYGAIFWGGGGTVRDCILEGGEVGVALLSSDTDIVDCSFTGFEERAILRTWDSDGKVEGVTYEGNHEDLVTKRWVGILGTQTVISALHWYCVVLVVVVAVVGLGYIVAAFMKEVRRIQRTERAVELDSPELGGGAG